MLCTFEYHKCTSLIKTNWSIPKSPIAQTQLSLQLILHLILPTLQMPSNFSLHHITITICSPPPIKTSSFYMALIKHHPKMSISRHHPPPINTLYNLLLLSFNDIPFFHSRNPIQLFHDTSQLVSHDTIQLVTPMTPSHSSLP